MNEQKVCIIGGGLTGLVTATVLSRLNLKIDLITGNNYKSLKSHRTLAISQSNYDFLNKTNIFKFAKKDFWSCSQMKLYTETKKEKFTKIFELNRDKKLNNQILYMIKNSKLMNCAIKDIKKNKLISIKNNKMISEINNSGLLSYVKFGNTTNSKYNLIIFCTGENSNLTNKFFNDQVIKHSYQESSITTILKHSSFENITARQIFLNNEILALLPISNTETSIVWSIKKNEMYKHQSKEYSLFKKKIKLYTKDYLKNIKFTKNIEYKDLNFLIRTKYYKNRILLFGDALHIAHPFMGQAFNMTLRDLASLKQKLKNKIELGLDIGSSDILSEYSDEIKPRNFIYSLGIDLVKDLFSKEKKNFRYFRNNILMKLNNSNLAKEFFLNLADKGFKF